MKSRTKTITTTLAELVRERGITALVSTAYMDEATRFHNLSLMYGGKVLAAGEPDSIRRQASGSLVELSAESQIEALDRIKTHYPQAEAVAPRLRVFVDDQLPDVAAHMVSDLLSGFAPKDLQAVVPLLYRRMMKEQNDITR